MLERIARAICRAGGRNPDDCTFGSGSISSDGTGGVVCHRYAWQEHVEQARAAVEAIREPTMEMLVASWRCTQTRTADQYITAELGTARGAHIAKMHQRWQAMCDAIRREKPE